MLKTKKLLLSVGAVGLAAAAATGGAFASFSAETSNAATFQTGKLVLGNGVDGGTLCLSDDTGTTDNSKACDAVFDTNFLPGDSQTIYVELDNQGNADWPLYLASSACTTDSSGALNNVTADDLCTGTDGLQIQVQEVTRTGTSSNYTYTAVPSTCVFPASTSAVCGTNTDTIGNFSTAATTGSGISLGTLTQSTDRFYQISVTLPSGAGNTYQGLKLTDYKFIWKLLQS